MMTLQDFEDYMESSALHDEITTHLLCVQGEVDRLFNPRPFVLQEGSMGPDEFCAKLNSMSSEQIAAWCRENHVKGVRASQLSCPITNLARKLVDNDKAFEWETSAEVVAWLTKPGEEAVYPADTRAVELSPEAYAFVLAFDTGEIPDLVVDWSDSEEMLDDEPFPEGD